MDTAWPTGHENDVDLAPEKAACAGCAALARLYRVEPGRWHQDREAWLCMVCLGDLRARDFHRWCAPRPASLFEWADLDA